MKILGKLLFISFFCSSVLFSHTSKAIEAKTKSAQKTIHHHEKHKHHEENHTNHKYPHHHAKKINLFLGGNISLGISPNKDFAFDLNDVLDECEIQSIQNKNIKFNQDFDYGNGIYAGIGYMLNPNMQIALEAGYSEFKNKNKNAHHYNESHHGGEITSDIFHGMISFTQYFDNIHCHFRPYASVGAGFARINAEGNLDFAIDNLFSSYESEGRSALTFPNEYNTTTKIKISFSDLEKFTFAYQFGLGFETINSSNYNFGVGYKYFATHSFETHDDDLKIKAQINSEEINESEFYRIDFGSLKHQNHMINFFVKFNI